MTAIMPKPKPNEEMISSGWKAGSIEIDRIRDELNRLWRQWDREHSRFEVPGSDDSHQVYMRPSTMNVIAVTESDEDAIRTGKLLASLPDYTPSRSIVMARSAQATKNEPYRIDIQIGERGYVEGSAPVRVEVITICAPQGNDEVLASIATPLLVADLPSVLFIPGEPIAENELVTDLVEITDGMMVDTVNAQNTGTTFAYLAQMTNLSSRLGLGDLVWTRLRAWRELTAQFFDQPSSIGCLASLDHVVIEYAPQSNSGRSGLTAGLLFAGWLSTRLGWKAPGELILDDKGFHLTLRSGALGKRREVVLTLKAGKGEVPCSSLKRVKLVASSGLAGEFVVERHDDEGITTSSTSDHVADTSRVVHASCPEDRVILAAKLRRLRVDPVYRESLEFASVLWPEGFEIS